jgi:serine-type D-Ala-D-Ala carboxypeptidase/endopeptidase (penicillin-binding protein 4)
VVVSLKGAVCALAILLGLLVHTAPAADVEFEHSFWAYADSVLSDNTFSGASWSVQISSVSTGKIVYEKDADRLVAPASVAKVLTSATAISNLGPDYQFATTCLTAGELSSTGSLSGDLILQASGDPTAEAKHASILRSWADSLKAHGLRQVDGNLVMSTWPFTLEGAAPAWGMEDLNAGFAPAVDGFGYNSNVCNLEVLPGNAVGDDVQYVLDPPFAPVHVKSRVVTVAKGNRADLAMQVAPEDTSIIIEGRIPLGDTGKYFWVPVQDPALYFGRAFRAALHAAGITVDGEVVVDRDSQSSDLSRTLFVHYSPPLSQIVAVMNKESDNYLAEYVLRAASYQSRGTVDRRAGVHAVSQFLERQGIDKRAFYLEDGCGLSRMDLVSARALSQLLIRMHDAPAGDAFKTTLSVAGEDGTLGGRLTEPAYRGRLIGKTGSLTRVSTLAGYLTDTNGEVYALAILCNNFRTTLPYVRAAQDRLLKRLIEGGR